MTKTPEPFDITLNIIEASKNGGTICETHLAIFISNVIIAERKALQEREAKLVSALKFYSDNFHDDGETARQALKEVGVL